MEYPCKIGIEMPENEKSEFDREEHEFLAASISDDVYGYRVDAEPDDSGFHKAGYQVRNADIVGLIDLTTGQKIRGEGSLRWTTPLYGVKHPCYKEMEQIDRSARNTFRPDRIYRVKGFIGVPIPEDGLLSKSYYEKHLRSVYVTQVISDSEENEYLQNLLDLYYTKVTANSEVFGEMALDKEYMWYTAQMQWNRKPVPVYISVQNENDDPSGAIAELEAFWKKKSQWDKKFRSFAAKELLDNANEWQESIADGDKAPKKLKADQFTKKMSVESIEINNGIITVCYNDGEMFSGHGIVVSGTLSDGAKEAKLFG